MHFDCTKNSQIFIVPGLFSFVFIKSLSSDLVFYKPNQGCYVMVIPTRPFTDIIFRYTPICVDKPSLQTRHEQHHVMWLKNENK